MIDRDIYFYVFAGIMIVVFLFYLTILACLWVFGP